MVGTSHYMLCERTANTGQRLIRRRFVPASVRKLTHLSKMPENTVTKSKHLLPKS